MDHEVKRSTPVTISVKVWYIVCGKEAGGNVDRVNQLMQVVPENFTVLCGDDGLTVPLWPVAPADWFP